MILALSSCEEGNTKDKTMVYNSTFYEVFKLRVDSIDYIIARSNNGISIVKHGDVKN